MTRSRSEKQSIGRLIAMRRNRGIGLNNRRKVRDLMASCLGITNVEISERLGLSVMAVGRHVTAIREEWVERC